MRLYLALIIISGLGFFLVSVWNYHYQVEKIIANNGLDADKTFYSISSFKHLLMYTFTPDGLLINLKTNVWFPRLSLITRTSLIKYDDIKCFEMGQATTTLKLKEPVSVDSLIFRYGMGAIASPSDGRWRIYLTSKPTYNSFMNQLQDNSITVIDSATTFKSAMVLILVTALTFISVLAALYFVFYKV